MLLYLIQAHEKPDQLRQLVELLDDGSNRYLINLDPKAAIDQAALRAAMPEAIAPRVTVRLGLPATWGGISQVHAWLDAYTYALNQIEGWSYVGILSGACIPLQPQPVIKQFLEAQSKSGIRTHFGWWGWEARGEFFHTAQIGLGQAPDTSATEIKLGGGVPALIETGLVDVFRSRDLSPIFNAHWRGAVHCTDLGLEKRLVIRRLLPQEVTVRRQKMQALPSTGGWLWCMMRRDALEDILAEPILPDVLDMLSHFICPDELFLHTLLHNGARFRGETLGRQSRHFRQGEPAEIGDDRLTELQSSEAFFARKVDYASCPGLLAHVRRVVAGAEA